MRTIAVFQYEWCITIQTANLVNVLAEKSFNVHLFLYNCSTEYLGLDNISDAVNVHVVKPQRYNLAQSAIDKISAILFNKRIFKSTINEDAIRYSSDKLKDENEINFIGIEKKGFAWAGFTHKNFKGKLFYYSLELYETNPGWFEKCSFIELRRLEIEFHSAAHGTIIQDYLRASALFKYNNFPKSEIIKIPVSVRGTSEVMKTGKISYKTTILYFGAIEKRRNIRELVDSFAKFKIKAELNIHGPAYDNNFIAYLRENYSDKNVDISTDLLNQAEINKLIKKADIGICVYSNDTINDRLTAFSSEKIARYLKFGVPIISFYNESYRMLFDDIKCGVMIHNYDELEDAVDKIKKNYPFFVDNALAAYEKYYNFDNNIGKLIEFLE